MSNLKNNSIFITGTGTDVGKTFVSSLVLQSIQKDYPTAYFKPIQTGCKKNIKNELLADDMESVIKDGYIMPDEYKNHVPYRLIKEASPHLAAAMENIQISNEIILEKYNYFKNKYKKVIIEGAGGLLVPLGNGSTMLDLIQLLKVPTLLVTTSMLGTLNYTSMTLDLLKKRNINVNGIIINNKDETDIEISNDNIKMITNEAKNTPVFTINKNFKLNQKFSDFIKEII